MKGLYNLCFLSLFDNEIYTVMNGSDYIKYINWINIWVYYLKIINILKFIVNMYIYIVFNNN